MGENLIRDALEGLMVLAVGATFLSAVRRLLQGRISVFKCSTCQRPTSRAYAECPHCGASLAATR